MLGTTPEQLLRVALMGARTLPLVLLVPAFGLRAAPLPFKIAIALALGLAVAPVWLQGPVVSEPWLVLLLRELVFGLPLALGAAALLWAATMAGDLISDSYRDVGAVSFDAVPGARSSLGVLFSLLCAIGFLEVGAPARLLRALAHPTGPVWATNLGSKQWWLQVVEQVLGAIDLALAIAAPLLAVSFATHLAFALMARASVPVGWSPALPALRAVVLLVLFSLLFRAVALALFEQIDLRVP